MQRSIRQGAVNAQGVPRLGEAVARGNHLAAQNDEPEFHPSIEQFKAWYHRTGHWIYNGRAEAATCWITRGIKTLPQAPAGAEEALAAWVAGDTLPDLQRALDQRRGSER